MQVWYIHMKRASQTSWYKIFVADMHSKGWMEMKKTQATSLVLNELSPTCYVHGCWYMVLCFTEYNITAIVYFCYIPFLYIATHSQMQGCVWLGPLGAFYSYELTSISAWISNHMLNKLWNEIYFSIPKLTPTPRLMLPYGISRPQSNNWKYHSFLACSFYCISAYGTKLSIPTVTGKNIRDLLQFILLIPSRPVHLPDVWIYMTGAEECASQWPLAVWDRFMSWQGWA